jgi:hypothetical protein
MSTHAANRPWLRLVTPGIFLAVACAAPAWAQEATAAADTSDTAVLDTSGVITAQAQAVLDRMTASLKSLKRYSITAQVSRDEVLPYGYKLQNNETAQLWVEAPNKLRMEVKGDIRNRTYIYDGSQLTMFVPELNVYSAWEAPGTIGELVGVLLDHGIEMPLIDMLRQGYRGDLTTDVRVGIVAGDSEVEGVATDHLAFRQPDVDWQLWVEKGASALPRKLLITTRYEVGDPQYQAVLTWNLKPDISAKSFSFTPPAGATKIPYRPNVLAGGGAK